MKYFKGVIIGCCSAVMLSSVAAAADKDQELMRLDEVVVEASSISVPFHSNVLDRAYLQPAFASTNDAASLLRDVPGVSVWGAGGVSSLPSIHGLSDDRLRIKLDGMDLVSTCPNHMNPTLSYIDAAHVGKVKVLAGITPVSLGGDSIGGTIVVDSASPEFAKKGERALLKGETGMYYRSNGNEISNNLQASFTNENFSLSYAGTRVNSNNYKAAGEFKNTTATANNGHTVPKDEVGSTAYESLNHTLGAAWKYNDHLVESMMNYQDIPYQNFPNQRMDMLGNTQYRPSFHYLGKFDWGELDARLFYQTVNHYMDFGNDKRFWYGTLSGSGGVPCSPIGSTCASGMPMYTKSTTTGTSAKADIALSPLDTLRIGNEIQFFRLDDWWPASGSGMWPGTFWNINNGKRDRVAVYSELENNLTDQISTMLGVRYEHVRMDTGSVVGYNPAGMGNQGRDANNFNSSDHEKTDHNWDMTALSKYSLNDLVDVELGFAHKTRSPNLYERYAWSTWSMSAAMVNWFGDGNGYVGDIDLHPEQANTVSATIDTHSQDRKWQLSVTPYYTKVMDYIDAVQWNATTNAPATTLVNGQFSVLKFVNQSARLYGVDVGGKMPLIKTDLGEFGLRGLLSYTNGMNLDTHDGLYNIMPINSTLTLTHEHGGWSNNIETVMVGDKNDVSEMRNEIRTKAYTLVNLRSGYSWKRVRIDVGLENLFDKRYALPLGGAYVGQGSTMTLNPSDGTMAWGTAVPGRGRLVYTGVTVNF